MDVLITLILIAGVPLAIYFGIKWYRQKKEFEKHRETKTLEIQELNDRIADRDASIGELTSKVSALSRYGTIIDAEVEASRILEEAAEKASLDKQSGQQQLSATAQRSSGKRTAYYQ